MKNKIKRNFLVIKIFMCLLILFGATVTAAAQTSYYVSPTGSDSNAGTESSPFQTITKARDVVRTINGSMSGDIYVILRGGTYNVSSTITFEPRDSGTNGYTIFYEAYPGEAPVLNGGTLVTGWTQHSGNIYKATLNRNTKLRTLIVNEQRAYMANKTVNCQGSWGTYNISAGQADWAWISGSKADGARYNTGDVPALVNGGDVEIINSTTWNQNIVCVREVSTEGSSRVLKFQQPFAAIAMNQGWNAGFATSGSHKIQNAYEFLDSPGEFYFNKTASTLYYYRGSEDMSTAVVYAPKLRTLIDVSGTSRTNRVRNITFKGITFANTEAELPMVGGSSGKTTVQSSTYNVAFADSNHHNSKYRVFDVMRGVINVTSADSIDFIENTIKHIGNEGISLINDVSNCTILGNSITDIGGSGIQIGHPQHLYEGDGGTHEIYLPSVEGVCKNNTISNNYLYNLTNLYLAHQGITAYFVDSLTIEHNHIEGTNYGGVSIGWGWCNFDEVAVPGNPTTTCRNNKFNYNRVIECMKTLHDSGAFYTIGAQPNSEASNNYVKASTTHFQGVYHPDEGTAWYTGNNLVFEIVPGQDNFELNDWGRKHDNHYDNIYSTSSSQQTGAPNCSITNLHVYPNANWPREALDIIDNAGLEGPYQYLLPGNSTPEPTPEPTQGPTPLPGTIFLACGSSSATGNFQPDEYFSGGSTYNNSNTVDVSRITEDTPPAALFNNERYGEMSYTIPGFTSGNSYIVTLYFAETYLTSPGGRLFDVSINGDTVLSGFDIYAAAEGQDIAIARSFTTTGNASGQIVIQFITGTENPKINGISIQPGEGPTTPPTPTPTPAGDCNVFFNPAHSTQNLDSTFHIDVVVNSGNQELAAYGFNITYDAALLHVVDVEAGADGFLAAANTANPGEIMASGFDSSGTGPGSDLQVLIITFNAIAEGTSTLGLSVDKLVDGGTITIGAACGTDGIVEVSDTCLPGDANGDGNIDIVDALLIAQYYVDLDPANFIPENADTNCDGTIDIVDALLVAQYYVDLITEFC